MISSIKELIRRRLPAVFDVDMHVDVSLSTIPETLTWAVKAEVGQWLRSGVAGHSREVTT